MFKSKKVLSLLVLVPAFALSVGAFNKASEADAATVTVKSGDTISGYAQNYGVSIDSIIKANSNVKNNGDLIFVGDSIYIPTTTVAQASTQPAQTTQAQAPVAKAPTRTYSAPVVKQQTVQQPVQRTQTTVSNSGSNYSQFIANGGTQAMWNTIVMPESGGNPNITSPNGYHGLGQTKESWGYGSVATQTKGMINYAVSRYGSVSNAISFRQANGWW